MAYELDSEARERLRRLYADMSDEELFDLARKPEELTEIAREVLRSEMSSRKIEAALEVPEEGSRWEGGRYRGATTHSPHVRPGEVSLAVFYDALDVDRACGFLDEAEVPFRVDDVLNALRSRKGTRADGSGVALSLVVANEDQQRAMAVLREKMGLFPLQEVEQADPVVDDGTVAAVGFFGRREDAEPVMQVLDDARIWHRLAANPDGSTATEDAYTLEAREIDLVKAGDLVEKAMGLPEG
jgi:hypothetical protein